MVEEWVEISERHECSRVGRKIYLGLTLHALPGNGEDLHLSRRETGTISSGGHGGYQ